MYDSKAHALSTKALGKGRSWKHITGKSRLKSVGLQSTCHNVCKASKEIYLTLFNPVFPNLFGHCFAFLPQLVRDYQQAVSIYNKPLILKWRKVESGEKKWLTQDHTSINSRILTLTTDREVLEDTCRITIWYFPNCFIPSSHTKYQYTKAELPFLIPHHSLR